MKHVFLIHSAITFLVAEGVQEHLGLDPADVVYLTSRGYTAPPCAARAVPIEFSHNPESFPTSKNPLPSWRRLSAFDRWIDGLVDKADYHLYLPQTGQRFMRLLMSHRRCRKVALIEEGLGCHFTREEANRLSPSRRLRMRDRIAYRGRLGVPTTFDLSVETVYGLHEGCFPGFDDRVVVNPPPLVASNAPEFCERETILVLCGLASYGLVDIESDLAGLEEALDRIARRGDRGVRYKLHPGLVASPLRQRYHDVIKSRCRELGITARQLDDRVVLELVAHERPDIPFVVNLSSLAAYAAEMGSSVTSYAELIAAVDPSYRAMIDRAPAIFSESVEFFQPRQDSEMG